MLKDVVLGDVGPFELLLVRTVSSSRLVRSSRASWMIGEAMREVGTGNLGPKSGHGWKEAVEGTRIGSRIDVKPKRDK